MRFLSTVFSKQKDGAWMGYSLRSVFANVIRAEMKKVKPLIGYRLLKLHVGYVNDTLLLVKVERYNFLKFDLFHNNLQF